MSKSPPPSSPSTPASTSAPDASVENGDTATSQPHASEESPISLGRFLAKAALLAVIIVGGSLGLLWSVVWFNQDSVLFPVHHLPAPTDQYALVPPIEIVIDSPQGPVPGWFMRGVGVSAENPGPVVFFFHGNAEIIDYQPVAMLQYLQMGVSLFLPEFRGYGRAHGTPSQAAIADDMKAFHEQVVQLPEVDPDQILFHGRSVGAAIAAELALTHRPRLLVLESTFTSVIDIAAEFRAPAFLVKHPYRTDEALVELGDLPVLIIHGELDSVVPVSHAHRLHELAANSELTLFEADHNDLLDVASARYWTPIRAAIERAGIALPALEDVAAPPDAEASGDEAGPQAPQPPSRTDDASAAPPGAGEAALDLGADASVSEPVDFGQTPMPYGETPRQREAVAPAEIEVAPDVDSDP